MNTCVVSVKYTIPEKKLVKSKKLINFVKIGKKINISGLSGLKKHLSAFHKNKKMFIMIVFRRMIKKTGQNPRQNTQDQEPRLNEQDHGRRPIPIPN